jgi:localization factor PodJL
MKLGVPWTKGKKGPGRSAPNDANAASVHERLDDLTRQLDRLSRITAGQTRPPGAAAVDTLARKPAPDEPEQRSREPEPQRQPEAQARFDQHVDRLASPTRAATADIARYPGDHMLNRSPLRPIYGGGGAPTGSDLERTLADIAARQRDLDDRRPPERRGGNAYRPTTPSSQDLLGLEEQLRKITTQIESLRRPCAAEDAMPALRQELSNISRSLEEATPRKAIEAIEAEVRGLTERLDQSRQSGVEVSVLAKLEQGLAEVRDGLKALKPAESLVGFQAAMQGLARKVDGIIATQQDPVVLQQLEGAITGLRGIVAHVASDDTIVRLTEEIRGIAARLDRSAGVATAPEALANLEKQIVAIAEAIDQSNTQGGQIPAKFETMIRDLVDRIEKVQLSRGDTIAFGQLEERIAKLVEKLDTSGSRFNHLEAIERGLADMLVHLEAQRAQTGAAPRASNSEVMDALKRDLDSVNGTLNRVAERLAAIETEIRGGRQAVAKVAPAVTSPQPATPAPALVSSQAAVLPATPAATSAVTKPVAPPSERLAAAAQMLRPLARERMPIDPDLPPDHPLEPGAARARTAQSPAERIAASEAALGLAKPPAVSESDTKSDFIAAARRAARAASQQASEADRTTGGIEDRARKSSLRDRLTGRVKSMLVGTSVIVLTLGAVQVGRSLIEPHSAKSPDSKQTAQTPAILPTSKSTTRILPDPIITGSVKPEQDASQPAAAPVEEGDDGPSGDTAAPVLFAPQAATAEPRPVEITASIPPKAAEPAPRADVPLPQGRPADDMPAETQSPLVAAAGGGDPAAAYELAVRYIEGRGVPQSYKDAVRWLTRASEQGLAPAQFRLGSLHEKGLGVKKDLNQARRLYTTAAAKGNAKAMHNLAVLHAEGIDGKPDYKAAAQWFRKAADRGIADSQYNLGVLYARGVGVEQNLAESYKWFALAARQGDQESGRKRDEVAAKLDAESLMAARLAVKTWTVEPQPEEATTVKPPPGGWDRDTPPASAKRRPRNGGPTKLGPG